MVLVHQQIFHLVLNISINSYGFVLAMLDTHHRWVNMAVCLFYSFDLRLVSTFGQYPLWIIGNNVRILYVFHSKFCKNIVFCCNDEKGHFQFDDISSDENEESLKQSDVLIHLREMQRILGWLLQKSKSPDTHIRFDEKS